MIRELVDGDVAAVVALERAVLPPELFVTEAAFRHDLRTRPASSRQRLWVAVDGGEIAGSARAFLRQGMATPGLGRLEVAVRRESRRGGLGGELYEVAESYLREHGATTVYADVYGDPGGEPFLRARGFELVAQEHFSTIDPARVDLSGLPALEAALAADGFRVAPLRDLFDRPRDLWELDSAAKLDVPSDAVRTRTPYEDWRAGLEHPDLDPDGSCVVLHGDRPVAYAQVGVDRGSRRAVNEMTGTLPEFRRRGLARLVKLVVLRWAQESGIRSIWTGNDAKNAGMLALNEELGYRRFLTSTEWAKRL